MRLVVCVCGMRWCMCERVYVCEFVYVVVGLSVRTRVFGCACI